MSIACNGIRCGKRLVRLWLRIGVHPVDFPNIRAITSSTATWADVVSFLDGGTMLRQPLGFNCAAGEPCACSGWSENGVRPEEIIAFTRKSDYFRLVLDARDVPADELQEPAYRWRPRLGQYKSEGGSWWRRGGN